MMKNCIPLTVAKDKNTLSRFLLDTETSVNILDEATYLKKGQHKLESKAQGSCRMVKVNVGCDRSMLT